MKNTEVMPIAGLNSSDRSYDPDKFIMTEPGDIKDDKNYKFVGKALVNHIEYGREGRIRAWYRIGATVTRQLVCDVFSDIFTHSDLRPVDKAAIPEEARKTAAIKGLDMLAYEHGRRLYRALGIPLPTMPKVLSPDTQTSRISSEEVKARLKESREIGENILRRLGYLEE